MSNAVAVIGNKIDSTQEAIRVANEVERLEAVIKVMKDQMKAYVDKCGPIETGSVVWDYNETCSYSFTADQLKKVAENIVLEGKNPWELMSISSSNLKKLGWEDSFVNQQNDLTHEKDSFSNQKKEGLIIAALSFFDVKITLFKNTSELNHSV
jgi:hypothetical protein